MYVSLWRSQTAVNLLFLVTLLSFIDFSNSENLIKLSGRDGDACPPCFNCMLPIFQCKQFSICNEFNGKCECIDGFGGDDCTTPLCGSLSLDNDHRPTRNATDNTPCECDDGWGGVNCNVCHLDSVCDSFMPDSSLKGTCYQNGMIVNKLYQMCDVTNKKILEILRGLVPQVSFSCDKKNENCNFQFWIDQIESFYCGLDECTFEYNLQRNTSHYTCEKAQCTCIPGTMLCGKNGSIDISDFLTETIKGPGDFSCHLETKDCKFTEPSMNDLIQQIFGDPYITLNCNSGECLHYSEIPGYHSPNEDDPSSWQSKIILISISICLVGLIILSILNISRTPFFQIWSVKLLENDDNILVSNDNFLKADTLATLSFENISYDVSTIYNQGSEIRLLNAISGLVKPGEILAIMGGSGAGKTTLLDILAMKRKNGSVTGDLKVNGISIPKKDFRKLIGFVDQDDFLLPTLTVYETVLNSALLRLPKSMSFQAKQHRALQVLEELRILDIKDRIIGNDFQRGISGGEKRRVSIACELVTSPLVLFLDEPTSGLDSNNANNVVECLGRLAKNYNRTLVFSIHQPRSNIFHLFTKLVLLSKGEMIYSGNAIDVTKFLRNCGYQCPIGYNIADYLIDITFGGGQNMNTSNCKNNNLTLEGNIHDIETAESGIADEDGQPQFTRSVTQREWEHFAIYRDEIRTMLKDSPSPETETLEAINSKILSRNFVEGSFYSELFEDIRISNSNFESSEIPTVQDAASFSQQLSILCSRTFKNVYRDPKLLLENYFLTILLALFLGTLYYDLSNDISGFQNRMGLFFFILTYFGFITFTGLSSFALERIIFIKERSNNYYTPLAYYISKLLSDILPLRVIPPILLALIVYPIAGLNRNDNNFLKFIIILILFNVGISLEILTIGIIFKDLNNSIILSVLVLLGSILFSGLFINTADITNIAFKYLKNISIFYYSYESLLVNEVKTLMLREDKYGLKIEVPGATILSTFGFKVQNLLFDIKVLVFFNILFLTLSYLALKLMVVENK